MFWQISWGQQQNGSTYSKMLDKISLKSLLSSLQHSVQELDLGQICAGGEERELLSLSPYVKQRDVLLWLISNFKKPLENLIPVFWTLNSNATSKKKGTIYH